MSQRKVYDSENRIRSAIADLILPTQKDDASAKYLVSQGCPAAQSIASFLDMSDQDRRQWYQQTVQASTTKLTNLDAVPNPWQYAWKLTEPLTMIMKNSKTCRQQTFESNSPSTHLFRAAVAGSGDEEDANTLLNAWTKYGSTMNLAVIQGPFYLHLQNSACIPLLIHMLLKEPLIEDGKRQRRGWNPFGEQETRAYQAAEMLILLTGRDVDALALEELPAAVSRNPDYRLVSDYLAENRSTQSAWQKWWGHSKSSIHWDSAARYPLDGKKYFDRPFKGRYVTEN